MIRILAFLVVSVLIAGCRTAPVVPDTPEAGPYAGIPSVEATGPVAEAQPIFPTGDPELDAFLADLAAAIDRHDWRGVAQRMEPVGFTEQRAFLAANGSAEAPAAQLIAETLGIGDLYHASPGWDGLDQIRVVTFREYAVQTPGIAGGEAIELISGTVRLENGRTLPLSLSIISRGGVRVVQVPLG
ncbi:MAG: hypothetical protein AAGI52_14310 [Bacteroidota bacterium]